MATFATNREQDWLARTGGSVMANIIRQISYVLSRNDRPKFHPPVNADLVEESCCTRYLLWKLSQ